MLTPHLITWHNTVQKHITLSNALLQMFQHYWHATLRVCVCVCVCLCASVHKHLHTQCCNSLNSSDIKWSDIWPHTVFSAVATLWECPVLVKSTVQCQPIQSIQRQKSPPLSWIYKQHQPAYLGLWISACRYPSTVRNWFTTLWSCLDGFTTWYAFYKLHCNVVHTTYSSSQLYCSAQVSVTVFTSSNTEVAIFRVNTSGGPHINLALGRVCVWVCVWGGEWGNSLSYLQRPTLCCDPTSFTLNVAIGMFVKMLGNHHFCTQTSCTLHQPWIPKDIPRHRHISRSSDDIAKMSHTTLLHRVPLIQVSAVTEAI